MFVGLGVTGAGPGVLQPVPQRGHPHQKDEPEGRDPVQRSPGLQGAVQIVQIEAQISENEKGYLNAIEAIKSGRNGIQATYDENTVQLHSNSHGYKGQPLSGICRPSHQALLNLKVPPDIRSIGYCGHLRLVKW